MFQLAQRGEPAWLFHNHVRYPAIITAVHSPGSADAASPGSVNVRAIVDGKKQDFNSVVYLATGGSREGGHWAEPYDQTVWGWSAEMVLSLFK